MQSMITGFEDCRSCDWINLFWAEEGDPEPLLIAGMGLDNTYICPECRSDTDRRLSFAPTTLPAGHFFTAAELGIAEPYILSETEVALDRMTRRQHLRAFARWWTPWEEETRLWWFSTTVTLGLLILGFLIFAGPSAALGMLRIYWFLVCLFLGWRTLTTVLFAFLERTSYSVGLARMWREFGQDPLFPMLRHRLQERRMKRWLREWQRD